MFNKTFLFSLCILAIFSCKKDPTIAVQQAEATFKKTPSKTNYEAYIIAVKTFVGNNAADHANCFKYLTAASSVAARLKESQVALQFAGDAITKHGEGQNLSEPMTTVALISRDIKYKELSTMRFEATEFDRVNSLLKNNINWLDSALVSMKKRFVIDSTNRIDREMAMRYAFTADAAATFRKDPERSPVLLLSAAEAANAAENHLKAITIYDRVLAEWPGSKKAPQAAFMRAFTMENNFKDLAGAKKAYEEFLKKFPNDEFADDAKAALKNLGKTPEELVREFEKMNKK